MDSRRLGTQTASYKFGIRELKGILSRLGTFNRFPKKDPQNHMWFCRSFSRSNALVPNTGNLMDAFLPESLLCAQPARRDRNSMGLFFLRILASAQTTERQFQTARKLTTKSCYLFIPSLSSQVFPAVLRSVCSAVRFQPFGVQSPPCSAPALPCSAPTPLYCALSPPFAIQFLSSFPPA